jgi:hypothetical protein
MFQKGEPVATVSFTTKLESTMRVTRLGVSDGKTLLTELFTATLGSLMKKVGT